MATWTDDFGTMLRNVHPPTACEGWGCAIHAPSDHKMRDWPLRYAIGAHGRKGLFRQCPHGEYHPDPDEIAFQVRHRGGRDVFLLREAIASVSLSHPPSCECDVCRAGVGDEAAMTRVLDAFLDPMAGHICDGCCA